MKYQHCIRVCSLIARFMGPTWGPSGADRTQVCPMLALWTLLSGLSIYPHKNYHNHPMWLNAWFHCMTMNKGSWFCNNFKIYLSHIVKIFFHFLCRQLRQNSTVPIQYRCVSFTIFSILVSVIIWFRNVQSRYCFVWLRISRSHFSPNNSVKTPLARPEG